MELEQKNSDSQGKSLSKNLEKLDKKQEINEKEMSEFEEASSSLIKNKVSKELYTETLKELAKKGNIHAQQAVQALENMSEEAYLEGLYSQ